MRISKVEAVGNSQRDAGCVDVCAVRQMAVETREGGFTSREECACLQSGEFSEFFLESAACEGDERAIGSGT